nr:hypothetical protein CFP56_70588 [Quercus suber]
MAIQVASFGHTWHSRHRQLSTQTRHPAHRRAYWINRNGLLIPGRGDSHLTKLCCGWQKERAPSLRSKTLGRPWNDVSQYCAEREDEDDSLFAVASALTDGGVADVSDSFEVQESQRRESRLSDAKVSERRALRSPSYANSGLLYSTRNSPSRATRQWIGYEVKILQKCSCDWALVCTARLCDNRQRQVASRLFVRPQHNSSQLGATSDVIRRWRTSACQKQTQSRLAESLLMCFLGSCHCMTLTSDPTGSRALETLSDQADIVITLRMVLPIG